MKIFTRYKKLFVAAAAGLMALPQTAVAQTSPEYPLFFGGNLINWYYYGKDIHDGTTGWNQQPVGLGTPENPCNYGLIELGWNPDGQALQSGTKKLWVNDFPIRNHVMYGNAASLWTGDAFYTFFMGEQGWEDNLDGEVGSETYNVTVRKWTWTVDGDGNYTNLANQTVGTMNVQPVDLTYDPLYDRVYGIFVSTSSDNTSYKIGMLDLETLKVTYLSKESLGFGAPRCIAINSKGELYAIDASGNVYSVSKTDGRLTTIGNVGFASQSRAMSATFDFRTDKLYWLGFVNNGKISGATDGTNNTLSVADGGRDTGLFEVSTETGVATLLSKTDFTDVVITYDNAGNVTGANTNKYGKMQITGLFVEGSFTRKAIDQTCEIVDAPVQLKVGQQSTVKVRVRNIGQQRVLAKDYVVNLYVGDHLVATIDRDDDTDPVNTLDAGSSQTLTVSFTAPAKAGRMDIQAEVVNASDEELRNNKSDASELVVLPEQQLPTVVLEGAAGVRGISLSWSDPNGHFSEGAEDYAAFTYSGLGGWTLVDADKGYTGKPGDMFDAVNYPNSSTPKAFIVFNPEEAGVYQTGSADKFRPHSGSQYFAAFYAVERDNSTQGYHEIDNSDYMVSPLLNGEAQTVSFWAKGYRGMEGTGYATEMAFNETVEVLYTTDADNLDPATYEVAKAEFTVSDTEWTKYTADLPEGARHFALHRTSKAREYVDQEGSMVEIPGTGSYVLMVDDIEFKGQAQTVTGYRVYKNGTLFKELDATATSMVDASASGNSTYTVTAVYGDKESAVSNAMSLDIIAGIDLVTVGGETVTSVYDLRGRRVSGQLRPGVYVVRQGNTSRKVVIK